MLKYNFSRLQNAKVRILFEGLRFPFHPIQFEPIQFNSICNAIQFNSICNAIQFNSICNAIQFNSICNAIQFNSICDAIQFNSICNAIQFNPIQFAKQFNSIQSAMQFNSIQSAMQFNSIQFAMQFNSIHSAMQFNSIQVAMRFNSIQFAMQFNSIWNAIQFNSIEFNVMQFNWILPITFPINGSLSVSNSAEFSAPSEISLLPWTFLKGFLSPSTVRFPFPIPRNSLPRAIFPPSRGRFLRDFYIFLFRGILCPERDFFPRVDVS